MWVGGEDGRTIGSFKGCLEEAYFACPGNKGLPWDLSNSVSSLVENACDLRLKKCLGHSL